MRPGGIGLVLTFAACAGNGGPPTVTVASVPPPPPPPLPCIQLPEDASAAIRDASADGQRLMFCVGAAADQCFAFDVATGKLDHLPELPKPGPDARARVTITNPDL